MNIEVENLEAGVLIRPRQPVDMHSSPLLRKRLARLAGRCAGGVVVDLSSVERIDTSGLATLVEFAYNIGRNGGRLAVCGLADGASDALSIRQVADVLNLCEDMDAALKLVAGQDGSNAGEGR